MKTSAPIIECRKIVMDALKMAEDLKKNELRKQFFSSFKTDIQKKCVEISTLTDWPLVHPSLASAVGHHEERIHSDTARSHTGTAQRGTRHSTRHSTSQCTVVAECCWQPMRRIHPPSAVDLTARPLPVRCVADAAATRG